MIYDKKINNTRTVYNMKPNKDSETGSSGLWFWLFVAVIVALFVGGSIYGTYYSQGD